MKKGMANGRFPIIACRNLREAFPEICEFIQFAGDKDYDHNLNVTKKHQENVDRNLVEHWFTLERQQQMPANQ